MFFLFQRMQKVNIPVADPPPYCDDSHKLFFFKKRTIQKNYNLLIWFTKTKMVAHSKTKITPRNCLFSDHDAVL